jgi:hypothetical protein
MFLGDGQKMKLMGLVKPGHGELKGLYFSGSRM